MVYISLQDFLRTGILGPVRLGMSRAQVRDVLGDPEHTGGISRKQRMPTILKYGDLEFLYRPGEDHLQAIHMDGFAIPKGSASMSLDPWILVGGLALEDAEKALDEAAIKFTKSPLSYDPSMIVLTSATGVELGFIREPEEGFDPGLYYISKHS